MSLIKSLGVAFALAIASISIAGPAASAQTIVTIDEGRILRDSKAGKHIQSQLKSIETQIQGELKPARTALESEARALEAKSKDKTPEQLNADTDFVSKYVAYQNSARSYAQKQKIVANEFAMTERKALIEFNKALEPALKDVVADKKADIVLARSQVVYSGPTVDVSALVISKLDSKTPTIAVSRQRMPTK